MTIGVDLRAIGQGKYSGVEEYTFNLLGALLKIDRKNKYVLFTSGAAFGERYADFLAKAQKINSNIRIYHANIPNRLLNISFKLFSWPKIDRLTGPLDIFFAPNINLLPLSRGIKKIVTFHDLSFERYSDFFSAKQIFWHNFINPGLLAKKADFIIADSFSTKNDLMDIYNISADKIKVIYLGLNQGSLEKNWTPGASDIKQKYNLPEKFILYLGTIEPRKNIIGLIKAFELFKKNYLPLAIGYKLVIAGSKGWLYEDIFRIAKNSSVKNDIIFTGFIADEDKKFLYRASSVFVYPSFYEGFGFPPLEAMASGAPTVTSNCSSLPEVAEGAGLMVNPNNISQIAWAINEILSDDDLRKKMIAKGYEQVKKFSWEKCAREMLEIFEAV